MLITIRKVFCGWLTPAAHPTEKEACWEFNYWRVRSGQKALRHKIEPGLSFWDSGNLSLVMQFIPPVLAQHSLVVQTLNIVGTKQAKKIKMAMFITIQNKCKVSPEHLQCVPTPCRRLK